MLRYKQRRMGIDDAAQRTLGIGKCSAHLVFAVTIGSDGCIFVGYLMRWDIG